jgi:hypothetical protein
MSDKIKIIWRVEDGYAQNGPHTISFDREDWESWTEDERNEAVTEQAMQEISIGWSVKP